MCNFAIIFKWPVDALAGTPHSPTLVCGASDSIEIRGIEKAEIVMLNRIRLKFICLVAIIATLGLSTGRMASANRETKTAQPLPAARGEAAVNHLKQAGLVVRERGSGRGRSRLYRYALNPIHNPPGDLLRNLA